MKKTTQLIVLNKRSNPARTGVVSAVSMIHPLSHPKGTSLSVDQFESSDFPIAIQQGKGSQRGDESC